MPVVLTPARKAKLDEFGEVDRKLKKWIPTVNPYKAQHDKLEQEILSWYADPKDLAADQSTVASGKAYDVEVTPQTFQQKFSEAALTDAHRLLNQIKGLNPLQFFSLTLSEAAAHLGKPWLEKWVPKVRTGPRSANPVPRAEAVAPKKAA